MQRNGIFAVALIVMAGVSACSPQKTAARRLGEADRMVVTNPNDRFTLTVSNEQVRKIVQALEKSEKVSPDVADSPGYELAFFKGTNHIATIPTGSDMVFWIDKTPYHDKSGTLRGFYESVREKQRISPSASD